METRRLRLDFDVEIEIIDKEKGIFGLKMIPDPRRYERRKMADKEGFYDKYDHIFFPDETLKEAAKTLVGKPIYGSTGSTINLGDYVIQANERIAKSLARAWMPMVKIES